MEIVLFEKQQFQWLKKSHFFNVSINLLKSNKNLGFLKNDFGSQNLADIINFTTKESISFFYVSLCIKNLWH